jgi:hypothetical protein
MRVGRFAEGHPAERFTYSFSKELWKSRSCKHLRGMNRHLTAFARMNFQIKKTILQKNHANRLQALSSTLEEAGI